MTAIVPANIAAGRGREERRRRGKRFMQFTLSEEGQQLLLDPKISRLPVLPATYAKAPAGYPNPFGGTIQAKVNFDSALSESRYYVVSSLFDQIITFRHKELQAATKAIQDAEKRLGGRSSPQLDEAKKLAWSAAARTPSRRKDKELLAVFKAKKGDDAALRRKTAGRGGVEQQGQGQLRPRRRARRRREMILVAVALAIAAFLVALPGRPGRKRLLRRVRQQRRRLHPRRTSRSSSRSR